MWPFQELSLPAATAWANAASIVLLVCFLGGVAAAFVLVRTTSVKEHYWGAAGDEARARVQALEGELGKARAALAEANARAREAQVQPANAKAAQAAAPEQAPPPSTGRAPQPQAQPAKAKGSRGLTDDQVQSLIQRMSAYKHHHVTVGASPITLEAGRLADQLVVALRTAGVSADRSDSSAAIQVGTTHGIVVRYVSGNDKSEQFAKALAEELAADGINAKATGGLVEEIMKELVKQGRPMNDPANEWVVVGIGDNGQ
jgi:hypothetical protein